MMQRRTFYCCRPNSKWFKWNDKQMRNKSKILKNYFYFHRAIASRFQEEETKLFCLRVMVSEYKNVDNKQIFDQYWYHC